MTGRAPRFIDIDGKRHLWRDLVKLRYEQRQAARQAEQPALFEGNGTTAARATLTLNRKPRLEDATDSDFVETIAADLIQQNGQTALPGIREAAEKATDLHDDLSAQVWRSVEDVAERLLAAEGMK
jgi:hypothetical protein